MAGGATRAGEARPRVAVVGAGVSGLTAAYLYQRCYDVTLYEAQDRLGGHAHTHDVERAVGGTAPVDSGFIVSNERTYPLLMRVFGELGVQTRASEMSMSARCDGCGLEYAGALGLGGVFAPGKPMLEHEMEARRPGYTAYVRRTSGFVPRPPRRPR